MHPKTVFRNAFSTQISSQKMTHDDHTQLFAVLAVLTSLIPGALIFLLLAAEPLPMYAKLLGFLWMAYAELITFGLVLHEHHTRQAARTYFVALGMFGMLIGAGFFMSALSSFAASVSLMKPFK